MRKRALLFSQNTEEQLQGVNKRRMAAKYLAKVHMTAMPSQTHPAVCAKGKTLERAPTSHSHRTFPYFEFSVVCEHKIYYTKLDFRDLTCSWYFLSVRNIKLTVYCLRWPSKCQGAGFSHGLPCQLPRHSHGVFLFKHVKWSMKSRLRNQQRKEEHRRAILTRTF